MTRPISDAELEAYLDEELDAGRASEIEAVLRDQPALQDRLASINGRRNSGVHTLGEIWRRHRLGVPTREELGSYLLGVLDEQHAKYIEFRLDVLGCRLTRANLEDLRQAQSQAELAKSRQQRYYQSSIGYLQDDKPKES